MIIIQNLIMPKRDLIKLSSQTSIIIICVKINKNCKILLPKFTMSICMHGCLYSLTKARGPSLLTRLQNQ